MKKFAYIIFSVVFLLIFGCSEKGPTSPGGGSNNQTPKKLSMKEIQTPSGMKGTFEQHVLSARNSINLANSLFGSLSVYVTPPASKFGKINSTDEEWTKTWKLPNGLSVIMEYSENNSNFGWIIYLDGTNGSSTYNKWKYLEARETVESKEGFFNIFTPGFDNSWPGTKLNYFNQQNGNYKVNILESDVNVNQPVEEHMITVKQDNSGDIELYSYDTGSKILKQLTTWTANGTGHWTRYDNEGNVVLEGNF